MFRRIVHASLAAQRDQWLTIDGVFGGRWNDIQQILSAAGLR